MNLSQLRHLIALHETGSFSRAAERLHLTQPALSRSIQALEDELGLSLLDRIGKRNEFTAFGEAVLARARRINFEAEELRRSAQLLREGLTGSARIGMGAGPASLLMRPLLGRLALEYPHIRIHVSLGPSTTQLDQLRGKELDALVTDTRAVTPAEDLQIEQLPDMPAGFLCRQGHPLLARGRVTIDELRRYPVASSPLSQEVGRVLMERYGPQAHPDRLLSLCCEQLSTLLQVVCASDAVYLGVRALAIDMLAAGQLAEVPMFPALASSARYGIVTLAGRTQPPALDLIRQMVAQEIAALQARVESLDRTPAPRGGRAGAAARAPDASSAAGPK